MFFRCILKVVCNPYHLCTWIGRTSPNPDFVRPVEVFQGFFDIVHPCWHHESIVERSTIIQKSFEKINRIFTEKSNKNHRKIGSVSIPDEKRVRTRLEESPRRPGSAPVQPNSASGASRECPGSALERPESVQERSRGVPEPPRNAPDRPRCAPHRFFERSRLNLGSPGGVWGVSRSDFFVGFSSQLLRSRGDVDDAACSPQTLKDVRL